MSETAKIGTSFAATPTWILRADGLSRGAKHLYAVLASYANIATKKCCPSLTTLSTDCQANRRTVLRWVEELKSAGAIEVSSGGGRAPNQYLLFTKPGHALSGDDTATGDTRDTGAVTPEPRQQWPDSHASGDMGATAAVTPEPLELERNKKQLRNSERETARGSALIDLTSFKVVPESTDNASEAFDAGEFDFSDENEQRRKMARALCEAFAANTKSHGRQWYWKNPPLTRLDRIVTALQSWPIPPGDPFKHYDRLIKFCLGHKWWHDKLQTPEKLLAKFDEVLADFETAVNAGEVEYAS